MYKHFIEFCYKGIKDGLESKRIIIDSDGEDILIETIGELNGICTGDTITDTDKNGRWPGGFN